MSRESENCKRRTISSLKNYAPMTCLKEWNSKKPSSKLFHLRKNSSRLVKAWKINPENALIWSKWVILRLVISRRETILLTIYRLLRKITLLRTNLQLLKNYKRSSSMSELHTFKKLNIWESSMILSWLKANFSSLKTVSNSKSVTSQARPQVTSSKKTKSSTREFRIWDAL